MAFLLLMTTMIGCFGSEYDLFVEYDIDEANQIWNEYDDHIYVKRTKTNSQSIEIADNLVNDNEIYLLRYWEPFVFDEDELDWSENPYDDDTWVFYFQSLRMVSYLMNAYESTGNSSYIEKAQWFIESWMEHNPDPYEQASERAWSDHSTANRISTLIYFWDYYRNSSIFDEGFANEFLNSLRKHGEYTAKDKNYSWGINHGIYQDRALMQLAVLFPQFESSDEWLETSLSRLTLHLEFDLTPT
ncbi:MAG: heparinase II/III family protein, partial [Candidatus Thermoplasmatota archaeon]|nr:heparinase II/III family protein [Candidatus Thermoplasmatota archaeon]